MLNLLRLGARLGFEPSSGSDPVTAIRALALLGEGCHPSIPHAGPAPAYHPVV